MTKGQRTLKRLCALFATGLAMQSGAQYATRFEPSEGYTPSELGVSIVGQLGWYQPVQGSADGLAVTAANNRFHTTAHPRGGLAHLTCSSDSAQPFVVSRAQHNVTFSDDEWTVACDWNAQWNGKLPATDYLGSVSLQPSDTSNSFQILLRWDDVSNPTSFSAYYGISGPEGLPIGQQPSILVSPGPEWEQLVPNSWYRTTTTVNFHTGRIVRVAIQNLTYSHWRTAVDPEGWYLAGGVDNAQARALPSAIRLFAGGSESGNVVSYDVLRATRARLDDLLEPVSEQILLGTLASGGNLRSWAADDCDARIVCKFFVPNQVGPFIEVNLNYQGDPVTPELLVFRVKIAGHTPGPLKLDLSLYDMVARTFQITNVSKAPVIDGAVYEGVPQADMARYVDALGRIRGKIGIWHGGPSTMLFPCVSFDSALVRIVGN